MNTTLDLLTDEMSGSFAVRTSSGTLYAIRLDSVRDIVRLVDDEAPSSAYAHLPTAHLRRDGEPITLLKILHLQVGHCGMLFLDIRRDGIPTLRTTTAVLSISNLGGETVFSK